MKSAERSAEHRHDRLAELVWHLTDCGRSTALAAVDEREGELSYESALELVARGIWRVKHLDLTDELDLRERAATVDQAASPLSGS